MSEESFNYNLKMGYRLMGKYKLPKYNISNINIKSDLSSIPQENIDEYFNNQSNYTNNIGSFNFKLEYYTHNYNDDNTYTKTQNISNKICVDGIENNPVIDCDYGIFTEEGDLTFSFGIPNISKFRLKPYNLSYRNINSKVGYLKRDISDSSNTFILSNIKYSREIDDLTNITYKINGETKIDNINNNIIVNNTGIYNISNDYSGNHSILFFESSGNIIDTNNDKFKKHVFFI